MKRIKREKKQTHIDTEGSWAISYGDMITLLLGFFILFFSLDPADKKESKISQSLLVTMQSLDKEAAKQAARESAQNGYGQQNGKRDGQAEGGYAEGKASGGNSKGQIQGGKSEGESSGGLSDLSGKGQLSAKKIDEGLKANSNIFVIKSLKAEVQKEGEKLVINFPGESFFSQGSTDINKRGIELLNKFASIYTPYSGKTRLNIIGYSDPKPVTSKYRRYKDNLELSVLRAVAAQRVLQNAGIPIKKTRLMGFGVKSKLLAEESARNEKHKFALSRKVMLVVEPLE